MATDNDHFLEAVRAGRAEDVQRALASAPHLALARLDGATALHFAALENHAQIVSMLLDAGADANQLDDKFGMPPLAWANERGHAAIVHYLAPYTELTLHRAAAAGLSTRVRELLSQRDAPLNTVVGFGTPLHEATVFGHPEIVDVLLANGADPTIPNRDGRTALQIALAQVESNGQGTPIVNPERRTQIVNSCSRIAERLRDYGSG